MEISRIEFFCDERFVGKALRLLAGIALQPPKATPVINAQMQGGRVAAKVNGAESIKLFSDWLARKKLKNINAGHVKAFQQEIGRSPLSYSYVIRSATEAGLLKKAGGKGNKTGYNVVPAAQRKGGK